MSVTLPAWYRVENVDEIASPALLVYPDRIKANIQRMLALTGGAARLFPHVKTHKMAEVVRFQQAAGIDKFKCATIAEAEMVAGCGAARVLLAYQPVGPNIARFLELMARFPQTKFAAIVDDAATLRVIADAAKARGVTVELLLDIDCGMRRTGIPPSAAAAVVYRLLASLPGVTPGGLHAYDGHIRDQDPQVRRSVVQAAMQPVRALRRQMQEAGLAVPRIVAGGTPTFPIHARESDVECSPGTCLLWDCSYTAMLPDLGFLNAAVVLTRVISKPGANRLCLDLGHKAIASENPHPRVQLLDLPDAVAVGHSEEHLVVETPRATEFNVGDALYGIPRHICPTVALHASVIVVNSRRADGRWKVAARDRVLTI
ncbi:MAG: D-TA family PLP-dependent enzyme [Opitutaceae bacterium]|nr:D-TA family PLP-dependent enzyme [Opitutaceae bacterium]